MPLRDLPNELHLFSKCHLATGHFQLDLESNRSIERVFQNYSGIKLDLELIL